MADIKVESVVPARIPAAHIGTMKQDIQELVQKGTEDLGNPALERCSVAPESTDKFAKQAYDRMYHTHNRS